MDINIIEGLDSLPNLELFILYYDIKHVIEDKELNEEIIFDTIKELTKYSRLQYDKLTLYLESKGYKRETISKKILDLISTGKLDYIQSWTTPIHLIYEGKEHVDIGFIILPEEDRTGNLKKEIFVEVRERQKLKKEKENYTNYQ